MCPTSMIKHEELESPAAEGQTTETSGTTLGLQDASDGTNEA